MKFINRKNSLNKFKDPTMYSNWLTKMLKNKEIIKVRNDLYYLVDKKVDRFEIASWINEESFICYHSALEYYGLANQYFNVVYVGCKSKFNTFKHEGCVYKHIPYFDSKNVVKVKGKDINVTTLEQTIIDCIDNVGLAGGFEELLNVLEILEGFDENKCLSILKNNDKGILYQKVGYLFEYFKDSLYISNDFLNECMKHIPKKVSYLAYDSYKDFVFNKKWNLMVPVNMLSIIHQGLNDGFEKIKF